MRPSFRLVLHQVDLINASSGSSVEDLTLASVLITQRKELYSPLTPWRVLCDITTLRGSRSCIDCECTALDPAPPETRESACAERVAQVKMSRLRRRRHREQVDYADAEIVVADLVVNGERRPGQGETIAFQQKSRGGSTPSSGYSMV